MKLYLVEYYIVSNGTPSINYYASYRYLGNALRFVKRLLSNSYPSCYYVIENVSIVDEYLNDYYEHDALKRLNDSYD